MSSTATAVVVSGTTANKAGTITLKGTGVNVPVTGAQDYESELSTVSALELAATSPAMPACSTTVITGCIPYSDAKSADIKYVGVGSSAPLFDDPADGYLYFGVAGQGSWRTAASQTEYDVLVDINGDSEPDMVVFNTRVTDTDVFVSEAVDLASGEDVDVELLNDFGGGLDTSKMHGDVLVMPVSIGLIMDFYGSAFNATGTIHYQVESYSGYVPGVVDTVGATGSGLTLGYASLAPFLTVSGEFGVTLNDDQPGAKLHVVTNQASKTVDKAQGILLLHHNNATGNRAEVLTVVNYSKVALTLSPTTVGKGKKAKATATVSVAGLTAPGGDGPVHGGQQGSRQGDPVQRQGDRHPAGAQAGKPQDRGQVPRHECHGPVDVVRQDVDRQDDLIARPAGSFVGPASLRGVRADGMWASPNGPAASNIRMSSVEA